MGISFGPFMLWLNEKNKASVKRPDVPIHYKQKILDAYLADIEELETMLVRDISQWKRV